MTEKTEFKTKAKEMIKLHEGLAAKPYKCPSGKLTIGFGRNLDDLGISRDEADMLLNNDIERVVKELEWNLYFFEQLPDTWKRVLIDMCFNLGISRLLQFHRMLNAMSDGDAQAVVIEMRDSKWYRQVPNRANTLIRIIEESE